MMRSYAFFFEAWRHGAPELVKRWKFADVLRATSDLLVLLSIFFVSFTSLLQLACLKGLAVLRSTGQNQFPVLLHEEHDSKADDPENEAQGHEHVQLHAAC